MAIFLKKLNKKLSPYTGLDRSHWMQIGQYLLDGVFSHVDTIEDPIVFPKVAGVSYPRVPDTNGHLRSNEFESLIRSFFMAAPMIQEDPNLKAGGFSLKDYYSQQILLATNPRSKNFVGFPETLIKEDGVKAYQQNVEGAGLAIGLMQCMDTLWADFSQKEKNQIAKFFQKWTSSLSHGHNWRFFNVLMGTFLMCQGYKIDMTTYYDHLHSLAAWYTGDGWYRDGLLFNYYCPWAFHLYAPLWCKWWGYKNDPQLAKMFEKRHLEFQNSYPSFFGEKGESLLWGRSISYRFAASSAFPASYFLKKTKKDMAGEYRRICSGNLLQFVKRDDFLHNDVPSLGFYGNFDGLMQSYSCAASPFWCAKLFLALSLPKDHAFWSDTEINKTWELETKKKEIFNNKFLKGPGILITNQKKSGSAEIRTCKVDSNEEWDSKLAFNSHFHSDMLSKKGPSGMQYSFHLRKEPNKLRTPQKIRFIKFDGSVLYRQLCFDAIRFENMIDTAEIIIPNGVLRVDRLRLGAVQKLFLGHFGLPAYDENEIKIKKCHTKFGDGLQGVVGDRHLAMVNLHGWDSVSSQKNKGLHPEATKSELIFAKLSSNKRYPGVRLVASLQLNKVSKSGWKKAELDIIENFEILDHAPSGEPNGAKIKLKTGEQYTIDFACSEGSLSI